MAVGDDIGTVLDERGDTLETVFWGLVFLFTVALFFIEFGIGVLEPDEAGLLPIATIVDFKQTMFLTAILGGGGVVLLLTYALIRYSTAFRDEPAPLRPGEGSFKFVVYVLAVLAIVGTTIFIGAATLAQTDEASAATAAEKYGVEQRLDMHVTGAQWFWRFDVDGIPGAQADQVVLPADTLIVFQTTSADVIHSFAIKELGITKDALPGQTNRAWFYVGHVEGETELTYTTQDGTTATVPADSYDVRCAELCGKGHSKMVATVYVVSPEDYEAYAQANGGEAAFQSTGVSDGEGDDHAEEEGGHDEAEAGATNETDDHDETDEATDETTSDGQNESSSDGQTESSGDGHDDSSDDHQAVAAPLEVTP